MARLSELINIIKVIRSARACEDFLWGDLNKKWNFEEWKRMLAKRVHKIIKIDINNPHWKIELKKRLLQNACVSIALLNEIESLKCDDLDGIVSNLDEYADKVRKCEAKK